MLLKSLYNKFLQNWSNTTREKYARAVGVQLGENCRLYSTNFSSEPYLIYIGNHVTITGGVQFIPHDGGLWVLREEFPQADYIRPIIIFDNCFIGSNSIILPGLTIGPNTVIGAGSVVTKSIPADSVAAGVPAKVISTLDKYQSRIDEEQLFHHIPSKEKKELLLSYFGSSLEEWLAKIDELDKQQSDNA